MGNGKDSEIDENNLTAPGGELTPIEEMSSKMRDFLERYALIDIYKDYVRQETGANQVDIDELLYLWLSDTQKSEITKNSYRAAVLNYIQYLKPLKVSPILAKASHVSRYVIFLEDRYKPNSVRMYMSACASFYSYLVRQGIINNNPVRGTALPKKESKTIPVMSTREYNEILDEIKKRMIFPGRRSCDQRTREGAKKLLLAVHIMATYGLRVSEVHTIEVQGNYLCYLTKGNKILSRTMEAKTKDLLKDYNGIRPLSAYNVKSMQGAIKNITKFLYSSSVIRYEYSCHDLVNYYRNS